MRQGEETIQGTWWNVAEDGLKWNPQGEGEARRSSRQGQIFEIAHMKETVSDGPDFDDLEKVIMSLNPLEREKEEERREGAALVSLSLLLTKVKL